MNGRPFVQCPNRECRSPNPLGASYCGQCGHPLQLTAPPSSGGWPGNCLPTTPRRPFSPAGGGWTRVAIVVAVAAGVVAAVATFRLVSDQPRAALVNAVVPAPPPTPPPQRDMPNFARLRPEVPRVDPALTALAADPRRDAVYFELVGVETSRGDKHAFARDTRVAGTAPTAYRLGAAFDDGTIVLIDQHGIAVRVSEPGASGVRPSHYYYELGRRFSERIHVTPQTHPHLSAQLNIDGATPRPR